VDNFVDNFVTAFVSKPSANRAKICLDICKKEKIKRKNET
jgi:hypothetical protein